MEYKTEDISPQKWTKIRNPIRVAINAVVCELCKYLPSYRVKNFFYRLIGVDIGEDVVISPQVQLDPFFPEKITIEDNTVIGWDSKIFTHEFSTNRMRKGPVKIGRNCLIGGNSIIRPGVKIEENSVVAASTYVNQDVEPNEEVGGVPEHHIKFLDS